MKLSLLTSAILGMWSLAGLAAPYASSTTSIGGVLSFVINEPADNVTVVFNGGESTSDMGAVNPGTYTLPLPLGTPWRIEVMKNAGPGWKDGVVQQISSDTNPLVNFGNARGLTVNRNAGSAYFGRVYVSVGAAGTSTGPVPRMVSDGIYPLNADLSATGLGNGAQAGSLFSSGNSSSPYRLSVGEADYVFISDWSDGNGSVFMTDANCGEGLNLLGGIAPFTVPLGDTKNHGSIASVVTTGSWAAGTLKLWVVDQDLQSDRNSSVPTELNSVWRYDVNGSPLPVNALPQKIATTDIATNSQDCDLARAPDGTLYKSQQRANGSVSGVTMIGANGDLLFDSLAQWRDFNNDQTLLVDVFADTRGIDVSADGQYLAVIRTNNVVQVVPVSTAGGFDFARRIQLTTTPATTLGRDIRFDAAGNLYTISSGQQLLRVYAPGGRSLAVTTSDNTFSISSGLPAPILAGFNVTETTLTIHFSAAEAAPSEFRLLRSAGMDAWAPDSGAVITGTAPDFTCTAAVTNLREFFRIQRL